VTKPVSVQLYSLRAACEQDFDAVLTAISGIGYAGVEPANLYGKSPREFRTRAEELGMAVSSSHYPWANRTSISEVIDVAGELGVNRVVGGYMPDDFADRGALMRTVEDANRLVEDLGAAGLKLCLHNHWWEFDLIDDTPAYHLFQDLVPSVEFEIDTYWAAAFGTRDPAQEVARVRERTPLLHIKDGPLVQNEPHVACGRGMMNTPDVIAAASPDVLEWLVVELDTCASDMLTAVADSYTYLTENNLAKGNV
jgi:sugar phosphate isomerase/epimerase|tara:strand:+ start:515 stop:1273 length:759 start_codon:yes stop_codon:yes gene_type:complete